MLSHGLGVTVGIFSLDTVRKNIVEYLVAKKYDVWLFEWRAAASGKIILNLIQTKDCELIM